MRSIYRYTLDAWKGQDTFGLTGDPVAFGYLSDLTGIEFWAEYDSDAKARNRTFAIVGTGHPIPEGATYTGTAPRTPLGLVWHLYELHDTVLA